MEGSVAVADLDETMKRLMLKDSNKIQDPADTSDNLTEDVYNQVDQFLREALQNTRERVSVLRLERAIVKFICDPKQHQLEFKDLPTSYLRLAAHRVAQHYSLHSMVLSDNNLPDSSGFTIIVQKTPQSRLSPIRLSEIPTNLQSDEDAVVKVAIKQRPQKPSQGTADSNSLNANSTKTVEEREEDYIRARARIFNENNISGSVGKPESEPRLQDSSQQGSMGNTKMEEKCIPIISDIQSGRGSNDSTASSSRSARNRMENEPGGRNRPNNRVAIFRDREVERKDPDYDRNHDRYMQRLDPGFGLSGAPYAMQPMYTHAVNYGTEFPQLGAAHRSHISAGQQARPLPQYLPAPWPVTPTHGGLAYGHPETIMTSFNPNHVGARSTATMFLHSSQYPCQHPGMPFIHAHDHIYQPFPQSYQQQPDVSFGLARPR